MTTTKLYMENNMSSSCPSMQYDTSYKDVKQTINLDLCNNTALDHSEA